MFGGKQDLADVMRSSGATCRLMACMTECGSVRIVTVRVQVRVRQWFERIEDVFPARSPHGHQFGARLWVESSNSVSRLRSGFSPSVVRKFRQRERILPDHVFHDDGDGVRFRIERGEQSLVGALLHGALGQFFVIAEEADGILQVRRR